MKRLTTSFQIRNDKQETEGKAPIYLRIIIDGNRADLSTKQWILPSNWDKNKQCVKGRNEEAQTINNYLIDVKAKVQKEFNLLCEAGENFTISDLKNAISGKKVKSRTLFSVFEENNKLLNLEIGKKYSKRTVRQYETTLIRLKEFLKKEYNQKDILLSDLNINFIRRFEIYLRSEYKSDDNTVIKYLKQLKKVIHYAMDLGYISADPFRSYSTSFKETNRGYLTEQELLKIETHDFKIKRLDEVRDVFVFVCYTGLSYSDLKNLNKKSISKGIDGKNWIIYERNKTGIRASIPILSPAQKILDKYADNPYCLTNNLLLPVKSNQKLNSYLSEIEVICEINKHITMHLGRHTFATTVTLTNGIKMETVQKMLGHKNIATTQIYSKVVDTKIAEEMNMLEDRLNKPVILANAQ